ncbi:MAG: pantoate--beta-alanine ligase [Bryobacteraceae bacterium]
MSAELIPSILELRHRLAEVRRAGRVVGFVPTMGALHAGHGSLIEMARQQTDCVVVSVFVNPTQFNQQQDYDFYPRPLAEDLEFCSARGVDIVFAPAVEEMYPGAQSVIVDVLRVTDHLCGKFRPGHFRGVTTVVLKLLNIVQPDRAYFGEKDAQQLAAIGRMVADLDVPVQIVAGPTVREDDGLALSSRNRRLSPAERRIAPAVHGALKVAEEQIAAGATDPQPIKTKALATFHPFPQFRVEYFEIVDPAEMQPVERIDGPVRVATAVWLGATRLIDNVLCRPATGEVERFT